MNQVVLTPPDPVVRAHALSICSSGGGDEGLPDQSEFFMSILECLPDGVIVVDRSGTYLIFNADAKQILGPSFTPTPVIPRGTSSIARVRSERNSPAAASPWAFSPTVSIRRVCRFDCATATSWFCSRMVLPSRVAQ